MANPFKITRTTQVGRNGFDLSQRHLFAAAPGQLLPIMVEECLPGDTHRINVGSFTRLRNLKTAPFARFKEYYDFFFVPHHLNWPYFNNMVIANNEPVGSTILGGNDSPPTNIPSVSLRSLVNNLKSRWQASADAMGMNSWNGFQLLADLLGYGYVDSWQGDSNIYVNLLSFAAYQRIYADYYRNPQWERRDPASYSLAWANTTGSQVLPDPSIGMMSPLCQMRYANWHKDYFMGLYPTQQFGDVSVVNIGTSVGLTPISTVAAGDRRYLGVDAATGNSVAFAGSTSSATYDASQGISIVDLRRAQALQRWKEVTMTNGSSMFQQVKAHFGFELPEGRKDAVEYVGGTSNVVTIQDITATSAGVNTSGSSDPSNATSLGQVGGKGLGVADSSRTIEFTSKDFGLLMCIYHAEPLLDYNSCGIKKFNTKREAADFYLPEFDKIGFGTVNKYELFFTLDGQSAGIYDSPLGYTSRYLDYKASYDRVHGVFMPGFGNANDSAWAVALTDSYLKTLVDTSGMIDYRFFKVNPMIANNAMIVPITASSGQETYPFMCSAEFKYYKTSNMSVDSLPY